MHLIYHFLENSTYVSDLTENFVVSKTKHQNAQILQVLDVAGSDVGAATGTNEHGGANEQQHNHRTSTDDDLAQQQQQYYHHDH